MTQPMRILRTCATLVLFSTFLPSLTRAGTWVPFGPKTYARGTGAPITVTDTFTLLNPATQYTLKVFNGGLQDNQTELVSGSIVILNGVQVIGPNNFNQNVAEVNVPIYPQLSNTLSVQVRGQPGGVLAIEIVGVDNDPPTITASLSPSPNAAGWNNSPVTVTFICSDKTSGVAFCPSPITVNTEGANQVFSGTSTDLAGNTASTSVTINLDMTPPTITGSINPPPDAGGYNSGPVTVTFTCADALSGIASCSPTTVSVTNEGSTPETGTAVDVAGNTAGVSITVNISLKYFKIRTWQTNPAGNPLQTGKCLDYGANPRGSGSTVFLNDCANAHPIRVSELGGRPGNGIDPMTGNQMILHHEVMLFAGGDVIGIDNPAPNDLGFSTPPPTGYTLTLQPPWNALHGNPLFAPSQIFRLDGDSIILEGNSLVPGTNFVVAGPCINTKSKMTNPCPTPPPQLVIQIQNARGAIGSPIVASVRNLADNEFWDFVATDGSGKDPTGGFVHVSTSYDLWNKTCVSPQIINSPLEGNAPLVQVPNANPLTTMSLFSYLQSSDIHGCPNPDSSIGWGTVLVVTSPNDCTVQDPLIPQQSQDIGGCINFSPYPPTQIPAGVTIRGDRRGANFGPQLYGGYSSEADFDCSGTCLLEITGDYARVTGLRVRGQSDSTATPNPLIRTDGVWVNYAGGLPGNVPVFGLGTITQLIATIDHNDMSAWLDAAITVFSPFSNSSNTDNQCFYPTGSSFSTTYTCDSNFYKAPNVPYPSPSAAFDTISDDPGTLRNIRVTRNFLHHNRANQGGYGVGVQGRAFIDGNTFLWNRHDITANGDPHYQYRASHNLVLSSASEYPGVGRVQDFDQHGTDSTNVPLFGSLDIGGAGGYYVEIDGNTFLGANDSIGGHGHDYKLRGYPITYSYYHNNVSLRTQGDAVQFQVCEACLGTDFFITVASDNRFADSYINPTAVLGVGDFDGDGDDDLFLATGTSWFYSPAGAREWHFLNSAPDTIDQLLLGDFDGDGRTDVVGMRNGQLFVSWGGISDWEPLNPNANNPSPLPANCTISDMAVGDFDGDGHPDIFCADYGNNTWWVSFGGNTAFVQVASSSFHRQALRFGDFNGDGTTDVFSVQSTGWEVSYSPKGMPGAPFAMWQALPVSLTHAVDGLIVADFDGNGIADVLAPSSDGWQISYGGSQPWTDVPQNQALGTTLGYFSLAGVGHFTGQRQADVLVWNGFLNGFVPPTGLDISAAGISPATAYSTQDMR